jgi:hypothetical protein
LAAVDFPNPIRNCRHVADDPKKKGADAKRISKQPHEVAYQKRKAAGKTGNKSAGSAGKKKK